MSSAFQVPAPIHQFFSQFPLKTYEALPNPYSRAISKPTLWIQAPRTKDSALSSDIECLKWQAYLVLRGVKDIGWRWDIAPEAGVDGHLPTLQLPNGKLLSTSKIVVWADEVQNSPVDELEGYKDAETRNESRAWVTLLEGVVHSRLDLANPDEWSPLSMLYKVARRPIETMIYPPPAPLTGISSPLPASGVHVSIAAAQIQYREAIESLSQRLGQDTWFLGSSNPTPLDAMLFAYLYTALHSPQTVKREVERHANLVAWEVRVRKLVAAQS